MDAALIAYGFIGSERQNIFAQRTESTRRPDNSEDVPAQQQALSNIQDLQRRPADPGYSNGPVNGLSDSVTQDALADFQQASGLAGTGVLDPFTQERLNASLPAETSTTENNPAILTSDVPEPGSAALDTNEGSKSDEASFLVSTDSDDPNASANEQQENRGPLRLVLIGLAIVALGGLGSAVLLLTRRGTVTAEIPDEESETVSINSHKEETLSSLKTVTRNGNTKSAALPVSPNSVAIERPTVSSSPSPTPKLAKVNIIDELIQDLDNPTPAIRRKAIWELGQRANSAAVRPLVRLLSDADSHEQSLILAALAEIGTQTLKPVNRALAISLQDENPEVRKNAIRDLTRIYDLMGQAGRMLGHAASDEDPDVRKTANWALDQLNHLRFSATESTALLPQSQKSLEPLPESKMSVESFSENASSKEPFPEDESSSSTV